jgi:molybdenum cofactor biosynthesis protein B
MSTEEHKKHAPRSIGCAVITVSDSREEETDDSGRYILETLAREGHESLSYRIVRDEPGEIRRAIEEAASAEGVRAILLNGGTGISPRDRTYEVVSDILEQRIDGFGELFRMLSFEEIGSAAMMSRAVAGTSKGAVIFAMPGSPAAVRLAMEKLILPELGHLVFEMGKSPKHEGR